jgi:beta-lactamase class A
MIATMAPGTGGLHTRIYASYIRRMSNRHRAAYRALWCTTVAGGALVTACHSAPPVNSSAALAAPQDITGLRANIESRVAQVPGTVVGVYYRNLGRAGDTLALNADTTFHAASTMKIGVMIQLFRDVDAGTVSLDQTLVLENRFVSIVDGSPYTLDPGDDSDSGMYKKVGQPVAVRELLDRMIERSSNLATDAVIGLVGPQQADSTVHALGATHMHILRGVEDLKAFGLGRNNTLTARDLATLLAAIQDNRAASAASCAQMRQILLAQEFNTEIPAGLPAGTPVAHKTGWITGQSHDAAIVYPRHAPAYILVVLTRGISDEHVAQHLIADISRSVYGWATRTGPSETVTRAAS